MQASLEQVLPSLEGARLESGAAGTVFDGVAIDSRAVAPGQLFVALSGERFDGHHFLAQAAGRGAGALLVERLPEGLALPKGLPVLVAPDSRKALGQLGRHWRKQFNLPVVAVTGSNGKTTVKEMVAAIMREAYGAEGMLGTQGNFNNEIGVPLTLMRLRPEHRAAVVELGMNHPGEIAALAAMARPRVALVNNAQREHMEFMESVEAVAKENGAVIASLPPKGCAVFPADEPFTPLWRALAARKGERQVLTFGLRRDAQFSCDWHVRDFGSDLKVDIDLETDPKSAKLPFRMAVRLAVPGLHNVRNALAAMACAHAVGIQFDAIKRGLEGFTPVNGRMQRKEAASGAVVIDDTYNANPDSVRAAIDVLSRTTEAPILVLGDMGEVGKDGEKFHEEIGTYARKKQVRHLLTLGRLARHSCPAFGPRAKYFDNLEDLCRALDKLVTPDSTVLVKGSRFMQMERVVRHLAGPDANPTEGH